MQEKSWSELIDDYSDALSEENQRDHAFMKGESALPVWVKYLMAMQLDSVANRPRGARGYGRLAHENGASVQQVEEAVRLVRMFAGRPGLATAAEAFRDLPSAPRDTPGGGGK